MAVPGPLSLHRAERRRHETTGETDRSSCQRCAGDVFLDSIPTRAPASARPTPWGTTPDALEPQTLLDDVRRASLRTT